MPLANGCDEASTSANIEKLISEGYDRDQAVAIALEHKRRQGCEDDQED